MPFETRAIRSDEMGDFHHAMTTPFGFDLNDETREHFPKVFEADRMRAAFDAGQIVGTLGAHTFDLSVPGGRLPMAGTTTVTVLPTHRRRGVMRKLMTEHLREVHERGEPLAGLWASESNIYGRFGYADACDRLMVEVETPVALGDDPGPPAGSLRMIDKDEAISRFPAIYDRMMTRRAGMCSRKPAWWTHRRLADLESHRDGATLQRRVLLERDGEDVGYLIYRTITSGPQSPITRIVELIGLDPAAESELWRFVFSIDLVKTIRYELAPMDSLVQWLPEQPRRVQRSFEDSLWLRILDVPKSLAGRRYGAPGALRFRLRDPMCDWNNGVFRLEVDDDGVANCSSDAGEADLELGVGSLSACYLGGRRFEDLAAAGRICGSPKSLRLADAMFRTHPAPWCPEIF